MYPQMDARIKAQLVSIGSAAIDPLLLGDSLKTSATAGPGAGNTSFFLRSGGHRVRLTINQNSPLRIVSGENEVIIMRGGEALAGGVLERPLCHCPHQAYIIISERCVFDCRFCPVPLQNGGIKTIGTICSMVDTAAESGDLRAISLTSGVADTPEEEVKRAVAVVKELRMDYDLPIGVSVYPTGISSEELYSAGATEIKYNVETMDTGIFERVCPGLSHPGILSALDLAVDIFGKNHVTTNFIIGLGEDDLTIKSGVETLAAMGVIPILRPISPHPLRKGPITVERPSAERLLHHAGMHRRILDRYGLRADRAKTMCLLCTGCDITPHWDV